MSHTLTSNKAVVYNAQSQASSVLTITPQATSFNDNVNQGNNAAHTVSINGVIWANYGLLNQGQIDRISFTVDSSTWDAFYAGLSITSTGSYDNTVEAALSYIAENISPIYGLNAASWSLSL